MAFHHDKYMVVFVWFAFFLSTNNVVFGWLQVLPQPSPPSGLSSAKLLELAQHRYNLNNNNSSLPLQGRVVVVTGAAGGMGQEICKETYKLGATVVALDCNTNGLEQLKRQLLLHDPAGDDERLTMLETDHGDLKSVAASAQRIKQEFDRIDILVNTAGITYHKGVSGTSAQGDRDLAFTINYLSHVLLTNLLLSPILNTDDARVIQLTSSYHWKVDGSEITPCSSSDGTGHFCSPPRAARTASSDQQQSPRHVDRSYANTKLAQTWHAQELHRRHGIDAINVCPTWVGTNIGGKDNRDVLQKIGAFDPQGAGLTSTLNAMFRSNDELGMEVLSGKKLVANSRILEYVVPVFKLLLTTELVKRNDSRWRDAIGDFVGLVLLLGQRFTHADFILQDGSPEMTQRLAEMKALHDWSCAELQEWM